LDKATVVKSQVKYVKGRATEMAVTIKKVAKPIIPNKKQTK
jgi:hypothetical protein